ncbi:hypothetical protein MKX01_022239 [Papaver californicum]|nr:hypothetical protein MKX01_022239 [Papaver californicum]
MEFEKRKAATLAEMASTEIDKSPKGTIDEPIIPLLKTLNLHPSYFSTSSCSGRISILSQPPPTITNTSKKKAKGGSWILISHEPVDPDSVVNLLFPDSTMIQTTQEEGELVFRFEPFILAVECEDISSAQSLVSMAISCGFRESGITSVQKPVIIAIRCSIRLEVPLGSVGKILVSPDYVRFLVKTANDKTELNRKRTDGFLLVLESKFLCNQDCGNEDEEMIDNCPFESAESIVDGGANFGETGLDDHSVGECIFVIGGREDPTKILNEVWVLNTAKCEWRLLGCSGSTFHPRHRHAAAVVGSNIYVFGGLNNETIYSTMHVLDVEKLQWSEVSIQGELPSARHSHSMVSNGFHLFMFGGYDGEKALGDLYSFDTKTCTWMKKKTAGRTPSPRFSHSMFVYKHFLGIVGGCPVKQHFEEVALLDLHHGLWKHVTLNSVGKDLLVRSTVNVVGDDLVIVGGGASCYAFGTKFSEPMKMSLLPLTSSYGSIMCSDTEQYLMKQGNKAVTESNNSNPLGASTDVQISDNASNLINNAEAHASSKHRVLQLERKYAKLAKDIIKKFGWLDLGRKVYSFEDERHMCLPVTVKFYTLFVNKRKQALIDGIDFLDGVHPLEPAKDERISLNEVSCPTALNLLLVYGGSIVIDEVASVRKTPKSPQKIMVEAVGSLIKHRGLPENLLEQIPTRWERLGDIVVLPGRIAPTGTRDSTLEILVGDSGWVDHRENGILYSFDVTKCMFSWGNLSEKLRVARLDCKDEVIVDLFAGIGYFVLPFLRVADRVSLGLLPNSEGIEGGMLHVHGNVKDSEETSWSEYVAKSISDIAISKGNHWKVSVQHIERVKWYGPHIRHLVADVRCKQLQM